MHQTLSEDQNKEPQNIEELKNKGLGKEVVFSIILKQIPKEKREICLKLLSLFKIDGKAGDQAVSEGQLMIFYS